MHRISKRLSFANVISMVALFVALGGTGYAASTLAKNSVGSKQIKSNAVTSSKVKNGSLLSKDFKSGQLPKGATGATGATGPAGAAGAAGPKGADGANGTSAGYARVGATGVLDPGTPPQNKNVEQANVQHAAAGTYCFGGLPFTPTSAVATTDSAGAVTTSNQIAGVAVQRGVNLGTCDADHQQVRVTMLQVNDTVAPALVDHGFYIWFEK